MKKLQMRRYLAVLKSERANTAEENTNRGAWWIVTILIIALIAGVAWWIFGNMAGQAQSSASNVTTSFSSQSGLDTLSQQAEGGSATVGSSTVGNGYKAP